MNKISKLWIGEELVGDSNAIKHHAFSYFKEIFTNSGVCRPKLDGLEFKHLCEQQRNWLDPMV